MLSRGSVGKLFLSTLLLGIALVRDLSLKISLKYKVCIGIIAFCVMMILQLATSFGFLGEGFSYYISSEIGRAHV